MSKTLLNNHIDPFQSNRFSLCKYHWTASLQLYKPSWNVPRVVIWPRKISICWELHAPTFSVFHISYWYILTNTTGLSHFYQSELQKLNFSLAFWPSIYSATSKKQTTNASCSQASSFQQCKTISWSQWLQIQINMWLFKPHTGRTDV